MTQHERERLARLEERFDHMAEDVKSMSGKVDAMHDVLMAARGARWAVVVMASISGFAAGIAAKIIPFFRT